MTLDKILDYLKTLIDEERIVEKKDYFILPTICHNLDPDSAQHKLYLYKNEDTTPLFHCYTECSETFNIYQFVQKYFNLRGENLSYRDAFKKVNGIDYTPKVSIDIKEVKYDDKFSNPLSIRLDEYNDFLLDLFFLNELHPWHMEGIDLRILDKFRSGYSKSFQAVSIPHYDWRGRLIGIRVRNYDPLKEKNFKYMPLNINDLFHSHPLSLNLYGIFENQNNIKKAKKVYLFEAEKSVLQYEQMFDNNIALATCGKNISKWQMDMLVHFLGVSEVIIGFDKEYDSYSEAFEYVKGIEKQVQYLSHFAKVGILIDDKNLLSKKDSPVDGTYKTFNNFKTWWIE